MHVDSIIFNAGQADWARSQGIDVTLKASFGGAAVRVKGENLTLEEVPAGLSLIPDTLFGEKHLGCGRSGIVENRHILHFAVFELPGVKQLGQTPSILTVGCTRAHPKAGINDVSTHF